MKKVLFVATVVQKHINVFHLPFLKMFQEEGYRTYVAASNDTGKEKVEIPYCDEYAEIAFQRNPLHFDNFKAYRKLKTLIQNNDFDIIHCHTPVGGLLGRLAARKARKDGTRVFYTAHGFHFYKGAPLRNWLLYYPVEYLCSLFTDVLITINQEDYVLAKNKLKARQTEYIPGVGINLSKFIDIRVDRKKKRQQLGIPEDAILLTSVGELSKRKNHIVILQALTRIGEERLHYAIVGNGALLEELRSFVYAHGLSDRVHFLGYRKDIAEIYKASDVCCFPSIHEGLPVALMEAMACGLPVVCSRIRGNVDLIDEGKGILVANNDVEGYIAAIMRMIDDVALRKKLGNNNLQAVRHYEESMVLMRMSLIYKMKKE